MNMIPRMLAHMKQNALIFGLIILIKVVQNKLEMFCLIYKFLKAFCPSNKTKKGGEEKGEGHKKRLLSTVKYATIVFQANTYI